MESTIVSPKLKLQVEINVNDLMAFFDRLSALQKIAIFEEIQKKAFQEGWLNLGKEIQQLGLSEEEILQEIKLTRQERDRAYYG